jgi:WD40 repeat protein/serine/threonine protein kinase
MPEARRCPQCSAELPVDAPEGLCPRCLLQQGIGEVSGTPSSRATDPTLVPRTPSPGGLSPGSKLRYFGDYELLEEIARGGMGVVYKARQNTLKRIVALKMILSGQLAGPEEVRRFYVEAEAAARLDHPNIVPIFEIGQHDGQHYFSMAFVDGESLARRVAAGPLPPRAAAELVKKVADAVAYAHVEGVVHRDLKPANVLIDRDGQPRVTDFGLAKHMFSGAGDDSIASLTATGQVLGTPSYMPPEQAGGESKEIGPLSDVYSLGAILYCLVTGRPPFQAAGTVETLIQVLQQEAVSPRLLNPKVPRDLETICLKCLEKKPQKRFASAAAFAEDLRRFLTNEPIVARPITPWERAMKWAKRRPAIAAMTAAIILAVLLGLSGITWQWREAESARQVAASKAVAEAEARRLAENSRQAETEARAKAETERDAKDAALQRAESLRLTAQSSAVLSSNPGLALLLAIEGAGRSKPRLATHNNALLAALTQCRERRTILASALDSDTRPQHGVVVTSLAISHDGRRFATTSVPQSIAGLGRAFVSKDNAMRIWDAETGAPVSSFDVTGLTPTAVEFSPDDHLAVITFEGGASIHYGDGVRRIYSDRAVRVCDPSTGQEVAVLKGHTNRVVTAHFSPDGRRVVTASWDNTARVWDARSGRSLAVFPCGQFALASATFSPDGTRILTVSSNAVRPAKTLSKQEESVEWDPPLRRNRVQCEVRQLALQSSWTFNPLGAPAIKIWDAESGRQPFVLGERGEVSAACAAFSPDGSQLAAGLYVGTVKVWDVRAKRVLRTWKHLPQKISSVAYSGDGKRLLVTYGELTNENQRSLAVWSAVDGNEIVHWGEDKFQNGIRRAQLSPEGRQVLILPGSESQRREDKWRSASVVLRNVPGPDTAGHVDDEAVILKGHEGSIAAAEFKVDGREAVTAGTDGTLRIWSCRGPHDYGTVLRGPSEAIGRAAFSPDGRFVLSTYGLDRVGGFTEGRSVRVWNPQTGALLHTVKPVVSVLQGPATVAVLGVLRSLVDPSHIPASPVNVVLEEMILGTVSHAEFSRDGRQLLTVSNDSHVRRDLGSSENGQNSPAHDGLPGTPVENLKSGTSVEYAPVRVWDIESGKKVVQLSAFDRGVQSASLSPDGRRIVTVADNSCGYVRLNANDVFIGNGTWETGPHDPAIRIWDAQTGKHSLALVGPAWRAYGAAWSADGRFLFTATADANHKPHLQVWDAENFKSVRELETATQSLGYSAGQPAFDAANQHVMLLRTDEDANPKIVTVWNLEGGAKGIELRGHEGRVNDGVFSPDGSRIVTASDDRTARVWNVTNGEQLFVLRGHDNEVHSARFSPDGQWIVTGSDDTTARVWYANTGREYFTLTGHRAPVFDASFSPDSKCIVTGSGDGTARIWPIDPLAAAISRKPRDLTSREREMFEVRP